MPTNLPAKCRVCGVRKADGHYVSRNGLCEPCGTARLTAAIERQKAMKAEFEIAPQTSS